LGPPRKNYSAINFSIPRRADHAFGAAREFDELDLSMNLAIPASRAGTPLSASSRVGHRSQCASFSVEGAVSARVHCFAQLASGKTATKAALATKAEEAQNYPAERFVATHCSKQDSNGRRNVIVLFT
jgi:hypothetical protein